MVESLFFYTFAALTIGSALAVILARHPIYAVLSLVTALCAMAALFVLLGAIFVAAIQVLIYAGAIMVLFIFVVMLLDLSPEVPHKMRQHTLRAAGLILGLLFFAKFGPALQSLSKSPVTYAPAARAGTTASIGLQLFTTFWLPFELASVLILVGIVGAVALAKRKFD